MRRRCVDGFVGWQFARETMLSATPIVNGDGCDGFSYEFRRESAWLVLVARCGMGCGFAIWDSGALRACVERFSPSSTGIKPSPTQTPIATQLARFCVGAGGHDGR